MLAPVLAAEGVAHSPAFPLLSAVILTPVLGAVLTALVSRRRPDVAKQVAVLFALLTGAFTVAVAVAFDAVVGSDVRRARLGLVRVGDEWFSSSVSGGRGDVPLLTVGPGGARNHARFDTLSLSTNGGVTWEPVTDAYFGGTIGAITGAGLTAFFVQRVGATNMLLVSIAFLEIAVWCVISLGRHARERRAAG